MYKRNKNNHKSYLQMGSELKFINMPANYYIDENGYCYLLNYKNEILYKEVFENNQMASVFIDNSLNRKLTYIKNIEYKHRSPMEQNFLNKYNLYLKNRSIMDIINSIKEECILSNNFEYLLALEEIIYNENGIGLSLNKVLNPEYLDIKFKEDCEQLNHFVIDQESYLEFYSKKVLV